MRIGLTFDLKEEAARIPDPDHSPDGFRGWPGGTGEGSGSDLPDDFQEEFDKPATITALAKIGRAHV